MLDSEQIFRNKTTLWTKVQKEEEDPYLIEILNPLEVKQIKSPWLYGPPSIPTHS